MRGIMRGITGNTVAGEEMKAILQREIFETARSFNGIVKPVELESAEIPAPEKAKLIDWFYGEKEPDGSVILLHWKNGKYLILHTETAHLSVVRLFRIGDRVELSVDFESRIADEVEDGVYFLSGKERALKEIIGIFHVATL